MRRIIALALLCAVLNPSPETFEAMKPLIQESYEYAREKFAKRRRGVPAGI